jgi:alkanesulfonate monooxygenase SsuD/methylene tetrahydromethanopterin reductase-like flavin-dependent oxidoreductase (luciferase family)
MTAEAATDHRLPFPLRPRSAELIGPPRGDVVARGLVASRANAVVRCRRTAEVPISRGSRHAFGMTEPQIEISLQTSPEDQSSWAEIARRCESSGFRALLVSDHPGSGASPFVALASAAAVTSTLRVGSYVVNAGVRDPLLLASEVATLDVVSDGRAELGIGAGHTTAEWEMTGRTRPTPAGRVQHLIAVTVVVRELLAGGTVPANAAHGLPEARLTSPQPLQEPVPVLVGGGNPALLRWGGAHADAVGTKRSGPHPARRSRTYGVVVCCAHRREVP